MLYLWGEAEARDALSDWSKGLGTVASDAYHVYKKRPGFFEAYRSPSEFIGEVLAPVYYPVANIAPSICVLLFSAVVTIASVGSLCVAVGSWLMDNQSLCDSALKHAGDFWQLAGTNFLLAAASILVGLLSIPHSVFSLVTRSLSTVNAAITGGVPQEHEIDPDQEFNPSTFCSQ